MFKSFISTRSLIIAAIIGAAALSVSPKAHSADLSASLNTQQQIGQNQGVAWGNMGSESKGSAIAVGQIAGPGTTSQWANSNTLGSSTVGAKVDPIGVTGFTGSMADSKFNAGGAITGNVQIMDGTTIINGAGGLANSFGHAKIDGNFEVKQYGSFHHDAGQLTYNGF